MIRRLFIYIFIIIIFSSIKCNNSAPTTPKQDEISFWPLTVGNKWCFQSYCIKDNNKYNVDSTVFTIINERNISFQNQSVLVNEIQLSRNNDINYIKQEDDGIYFYGIVTPSDTLIFKNLFLKYPCSKGERWKYKIYGITLENKIYLSDSIDVQCINTNVNINTFYGGYTCYEYFFQTINERDNFTEIFDFHWYISPSIGPVCIRVQPKHKANNDDAIYKDDLCEQLIYSYELK